MPKDMKNLHVELTEEEFELLSKWRGPQKKWKDWLLSIPAQLRENADKIEKLNLALRLANTEKDLAEEKYGRIEIQLANMRGKEK